MTERKTKAETIMVDLADVLAAKFFYNRVVQTTSAEMKPIWENICKRYDSGEFRNLQVAHPLNHLSRQTMPCTPLQAYLLEFNLGYKRV